jgi:hypothetical protein
MTEAKATRAAIAQATAFVRAPLSTDSRLRLVLGVLILEAEGVGDPDRLPEDLVEEFREPDHR